MYKYLKPEDVKEFEDRYREAASFLLGRSLYRERIALRLERQEVEGFAAMSHTSPDHLRLDWINRRLKELDTWWATCVDKQRFDGLSEDEDA